LRQHLQAVVDQLEVALPQGLPSDCETIKSFPARVGRSDHLALPTLLSQLLLVFTVEFNCISKVSLALCANALRVLGQEPIPIGEISRLTGGSPERTAVGWRLKPYVAVEPGRFKNRGKVVRLTPRGLNAQQTYYRLIGQIERDWDERFGQDEMHRLRESLQSLFNHRTGKDLSLAIGLSPLPGTVRAGAEVPALGRRKMGAAARQRRRDLIAQTQAFLRDPASSLPHYPLWDMNRGFGP
jgi:hypothetical protein